MKETNIKVSGMFCSNCELKIEKTLSKLDGIKEVKASFNKEEVKILYDENIVKIEEIEKEIQKLDYQVVKERKNNNEKLYLLIIVISIYLILRHFGVFNIFNMFPTVEIGMNYGMLFVVGLLTSVHCIAMCGGINLSQSVNTVKNNGNIIKSNINYNLGRVISYTVVGGIVGLIGSAITINGVFKGIIEIIIGIIMTIMGINMLGIFPKLRKFNIRIPKKLAKTLNNSKKGKSSFYIGLINGLMPCGPLQSMQLYALSTGSFIGGALSMFLFSLGTVPLMFGFGAISSKLNKKFAEKMLTISSIIIVILGISMVGNGFGLSGINVNVQQSEGKLAEIVDGYQIINTEIDYGSYEAITVKKDIPVKWIINVDKEKLNGCNNEIIISEYDIDVKLVEGENVIEFTPNKSGKFVYTCWMGMIKSTITVTE